MDMKTVLTDRDLYYDGYSAYTEDQILKEIMGGTPSNILFCRDNIKGFKQKTECNPLPSTSWNIPPEYLDIDLNEMFMELVEGHGEVALNRTKQELELYHNYGFDNVLRAMCYIAYECDKHDVPLGVGRGSSVASYLLYLLEIHLVDPLKYDLDIHEFLKE